MKSISICKKRNIIKVKSVVVCVAMLAIFLSGCGKTAPTVGYLPVEATNIVNISQANEKYYKLFTYNEEQWYLPLQSIELEDSHVMGMPDISEIALYNTRGVPPDVPVVNRAEEELILVGGAALVPHCRRVVDEGYTVACEFSTKTARYLYVVGYEGTLITDETERGHTQSIEEINGNDPSEYKDSFVSGMLDCEFGETVTLGRYSGTDYITTSENAYVAYYIFDENAIDLPVEQTKSGYFIADISGLEPGKYALWSGDGAGSRYIIEIQ